MIEKVLVANRGEIAVRIIRACREMGIETVAVYSTADEEALHVELADEAVCIGSPLPKNSYLNIENIISAAVLTGCDALHPGFGFLSENAKFADICTNCGIKFIGPNAEMIAMMGDKSKAREMMIAAGVPVVPGSEGKIEHIEDAVPVAKALCEGGLYLAEVTFRTVCAEEVIRRMKEACPQMLIGAGTVLNTQQVDEALASGAAFIVAPGFNEKVVNYCTQKGVPIFPGCSHASDIERAIEHGLEVVKFFPAKELGGLATIKALAAPYGQVNFMPTGGITPDTMMEYLDYERIVACGGSWMVKENLIRQKDFKAITKLTAEAVKRIQKGKQGQEAQQHLTKEECAASQLTLEGLGEGVVAGFGEMLLRLSAPDHLRLSQAHQLKMHYGGAEANVVGSLA